MSDQSFSSLLDVQSSSLNPYNAGIDFTDVCRRQIVTTKVDPRTESKNIYNDRRHRYSNESERAN